jgi:amino-acid N-acetyltransferase
MGRASLCVAPAVRGQGLGQRIVDAGLALARKRGARRVWLLTVSAERFFPRFGFEPVERSALPSALGASAELRGACPTSAVAMMLDLGGSDCSPPRHSFPNPELG